MKTLLQVQTRYQILKGDPDGTCDATGTSHINVAIGDITSSYPFSWTRKSTNLTLSAGVSNLPADYNPGWQIKDARIVSSNTIFTPKPIELLGDGLTDGYYISYDAANDVFVFNCQTLTGTVQIFYNYDPVDLVNPTDKCVIVDPEAVAYLAASKNWIGDERNINLKNDYLAEANRRILAMQTQDQLFGETYTESSVIDSNPQLGGGYAD